MKASKIYGLLENNVNVECNNGEINEYFSFELFPIQ